MPNGLFITPKSQEKVRTISSRVSELKSEIGVLERITKKLLEGKKLTEDENDTLTLLAAREEKTEWIAWEKFKKQSKQKIPSV